MMVRVALTGATGLLGRNLLFEFIKEYADDPTNLHFVLLGRGESRTSLRQRVEEILLTDGAAYLRAEALDGLSLVDYARRHTECVEIDSNEADQWAKCKPGELV
jgi:hypothetical protein